MPTQRPNSLLGHSNVLLTHKSAEIDSEMEEHFLLLSNLSGSFYRTYRYYPRHENIKKYFLGDLRGFKKMNALEKSLDYPYVNDIFQQSVNKDECFPDNYTKFFQHKRWRLRVITSHRKKSTINTKTSTCFECNRWITLWFKWCSTLKHKIVEEKLAFSPTRHHTTLYGKIRSLNLDHFTF